MKAIDIIKGFCTNGNDCEVCDYVEVPEFESRREYEEWAMSYYGFIPELKQGMFYLVMWQDEDFYGARGAVSPDWISKTADGEIVRFYEIEQ